MNSSLIALTVAIVMQLCSCASMKPTEFHLASSGHIGCPPERITIRDERATLGVQSWTAICGGQTYYCSSTNGETSCKRARKN